MSETNGEHQSDSAIGLTGGCSCGHCRYQLLASPLFVHACHCNWCQKEIGSAFATNALIETSNVQWLKGETETFVLPSESELGHHIVRCKQCYSALWSHYAAARDKVAFVRVGTLDNPNLCPPDIHIYTNSKVTWLTITDGKPHVAEYYRRSEYWPQSAIERYKKVLNR